MQIQNLTTKPDEDFFDDSIRCWQEALDKGDMFAFRYWAVHAFCFARTLREQWELLAAALDEDRLSYRKLFAQEVR